MKEALKTFLILKKAGLITNNEQASHLLGIYHLTSRNSVDRLWEIAHEPEDAPEKPPVIVGSEPVLEIVTERPAGGHAPGRRPTVKRTAAR